MKIVSIILQPLKKQLIIGTIILLVSIVIIVFLASSLYFIWEELTESDLEESSNLPGVTYITMVSNPSVNPETGEYEFIYNDLQNSETNNPGSGNNSNTTSVPSLDNFLFIGDSRYAGVAAINNLGNNIKNAGVSSSTIDEWVAVVKNKGKGTVQSKSVDITGTYSGISVQLGANGVYQNVDNTVNSMKTLITETQKLYPNIPIYVNSCVQVNQKANSAGYTWNVTTFKDNVNSFNNAVQEYCNSVDKVYYIDISANLNDSNGFLKNEYTEDGLHCNGRGQLVFADNIKNAILNLKPSGNTKTVTVDSIMSEMSLEEKIYQLMMVQSAVSDGNQLSDIKYGGYIVGSGSNYNNSLQKIGSNYKIAPFVATDDEGGTVTRAASQYKTNARTYGDNKNYTQLSTDETEKSNFLLGLGINLNLGPVTDVISNGALYDRSFSGDPSVVKECIKTIIEARKKSNQNGVSISSSLKHYPGYPDTSVNTDFGVAQSDRSMNDINKNIQVFKDGISAGAQSVMVSNVIYTKYDANNPASLSPTIVGDLRKNFSGVIMTDDIGSAQGVSNIGDRYKKAIMAGNDMILIGNGNTTDAYNQIKDALSSGEISEDRINESVKRILQWKSDVGLLTTSSGNSSTDNNNGNGEDSDYLFMTDSIIITKNDEGEYCIATMLDARINQIYKTLDENNSGALKFFDNEEEAKKSIKLWVMAEYSSQYLNLSSDVEHFKHDYDADYIQGSIKVKRYSVDENGQETEPVYLTYKTTNEFANLKQEYQNSGDKAVFNYFTIDENDNLVIAQYSEERLESTWTDQEDPDVQLDNDYVKYNLTEQRLNYKNLVREYTMPFNLLWSFAVYGKNIDFVNELAKLVIDNQIEIGIRDSVTTVVTTTVDSYLKEEHTYEKVNFKIGVKDGNEETNLTNYYNTYEILPSGNTETRETKNSGNEFQSIENNTKISGVSDSPAYQSTVIKTEITDSVSMEVEYIDSWFAEYKLDYTSNHYNETTEEISPKENTDYEVTKAYDDGKIIHVYGYNNFELIINNDDKAKETYNEALEIFLNWKSDDLLKEGIREAMANWIYNGNPQGDAFTLFRYWGPDVLTDWMLAEINGTFDAFTVFGSLDKAFCESLGINTEDMDWVKSQCEQVWQFMRDFFYNTDNQHDLIMERVRQELVELGISKEKRTVNRVVVTTINTDKREFNKGQVVVKEKVDSGTENFVSLLCKEEYSNAYSSLTGSTSSWFFKAIQNNEDTQVFTDLIRYLYYKATGNDYGVTEYDMSTVKFKLNQSGMKNTGMIRGDTVQAKVWFALKDLGFSDEQVAGVMGNIHHESAGFKPSIVEYGYNENNGGIGLCQWTNNNRGSQGNNTNLKAYAATKGVTWQDEDTQIEFLIAQMTGTGNAAGYVGIQWMSRHGYNKDAWFNATTIEEATKAFCATYENPGSQYFRSSMPDRIRWAEYYYNEFHGKTLMGASGGEYQAKASAEDGIYGYFYSDNGRVFTVYNQCAITGWLHYCNKAAAASILSAYRKSGQSDMDVAYAMNDPHSPLANVADTESIFAEYGLKASCLMGFDRSRMESTLKSGGYVAIHVLGNGTTRNGTKSGFKYTNGNSMHWIAILGYRVENGEEQIMISNSGWYNTSGWVPIDDFAAFDSNINMSWYITE